jgi:hypothetical protein
MAFDNRRKIRPSRRWSALAALLVGLQAGCGRGDGYARYVPEPQLAERALEAVLQAWQAGQPAGELRLADPPLNVQVADAGRLPGQRLVGYEILGEVSAEGPRSLMARLQLAEPAEEREVTYYLVGIDPLWVFRQEDYDIVVHWEACAEQPEQPGP